MHRILDQAKANWSLMNMPEFYEAFGCQDGSKTVRSAEARAHIW